ncbi:hypothetical protein [Mycobacterium sp.]|uniref:hypothetical protein n=1 Tax=Mycobacterium sp. TaxID=1785 RepID=UPI00345108C8
MTVLAFIAGLAMALCLGYHLGRRARSKPPSWRKRTSRMALGRAAVNLVVLVAARRAQQRFQISHSFFGGDGTRGFRSLAPLALLRNSIAFRSAGTAAVSYPPR